MHVTACGVKHHAFCLLKMCQQQSILRQIVINSYDYFTISKSQGFVDDRLWVPLLVVFALCSPATLFLYHIMLDFMDFMYTHFVNSKFLAKNNCWFDYNLAN